VGTRTQRVVEADQAKAAFLEHAAARLDIQLTVIADRARRFGS